MYRNAQADLEVLGCTATDTASEIKLAYKLQARRLQRQLLEDWPGANERLAMVNAAYDRLRSSDWPANALRPETQSGSQIVFSDETVKRLRQAIVLQNFNLRFELSRDRETGVYCDPSRRRSSRSAAQMPTLLHGVAVRCRGETIEVQLSEPPGLGNNIVAVPNILIGSNQVLTIGSGVAMISFSVARSCTHVRLGVSCLPFATGSMDECELVYHGHG